MMIEVLNKMDMDGSLNLLFKKGIISWTTLFHRDIYLQYDIYIKKGKKPSDARYLCADDFKIDKTTVLRAVNKMKK